MTKILNKAEKPTYLITKTNTVNCFISVCQKTNKSLFLSRLTKTTFFNLTWHPSYLWIKQLMSTIKSELLNKSSSKCIFSKFSSGASGSWIQTLKLKDHKMIINCDTYSWPCCSKKLFCIQTLSKRTKVIAPVTCWEPWRCVESFQHYRNFWKDPDSTLF